MMHERIQPERNEGERGIHVLPHNSLANRVSRFPSNDRGSAIRRMNAGRDRPEKQNRSIHKERSCHMRTLAVGLALVGILATTTTAAVVHTTTTSPIKSGNPGGLDDLISSNDCIQGLIASELAGDKGWHPAVSDPLDKLPALTDGGGMRHTGLTGLLNDFPGAGAPAKRISYDLTGTQCNLYGIEKINIFTSNNEDGRAFSTSVIHYSMDGGANYTTLGYFQSHPSGTINMDGHAQSIGIKATLVSIFDDVKKTVIPAGVTNIWFDLYAVDNTGGQMRDPFEGVNPFTGTDDGLTEAFVSPLVMELDVIALPEPATLILLGLGGLWLRRRTA